MSDETQQGGGRVRLIMIALVVAGLLGAGWYFDAQSYLRQLLEWISGLGALGVLLFIGLYVVATVAFLPGSILTLGAGVVFGVVAGSVYVSIAATLGASAAFLIGRYLARDMVAEKTARMPRFKAIDDAVAKDGWKIVGLVRMSPVFPFNILNYAFGLTQVSFQDYVLASWVGMLPGTIMYVYLGSLAGSLVQVSAAGAPERSAAQWAISVLGLVATITVTVVVTRIARKALNERVDGDLGEG